MYYYNKLNCFIHTIQKIQNLQSYFCIFSQNPLLLKRELIPWNYVCMSDIENAMNDGGIKEQIDRNTNELHVKATKFVNGWVMLSLQFGRCFHGLLYRKVQMLIAQYHRLSMFWSFSLLIFIFWSLRTSIFYGKFQGWPTEGFCLLKVDFHFGS